jgi:hypothetical protein
MAEVVGSLSSRVGETLEMLGGDQQLFLAHGYAAAGEHVLGEAEHGLFIPGNQVPPAAQHHDSQEKTEESQVGETATA